LRERVKKKRPPIEDFPSVVHHQHRKGFANLIRKKKAGGKTINSLTLDSKRKRRKNLNLERQK